MEIPVTVAVVYIVLSGVGLVMNVLTIRAIVVHGLLKKAYSAMYILYLQPLITDILFQLIHMGYVAPAVLVQNNYPLGRVVSYILDSGQSYCFFNNSFSHILLAVNRLVVTVFLRMHFFTYNRTIAISIGQHVLAVAVTVTANYGFPCCLQVLEFAIFNFRTVTIPGVFNYSLYWIRLPLKIACSAIPFLIYCVILLSTRSISRNAKLQSGELSKRRRQELRFTFQFAILAVIYTLSWVLFTLLPVSAVSSSNWAFGLPAVISLINASANAAVFMINDRKRLCLVCSPSKSTTQGSSVQNSKAQNSRPLKTVTVARKLLIGVSKSSLKHPLVMARFIKRALESLPDQFEHRRKIVLSGHTEFFHESTGFCRSLTTDDGVAASKFFLNRRSGTDLTIINKGEIEIVERLIVINSAAMPVHCAEMSALLHGYTTSPTTKLSFVVTNRGKMTVQSNHYLFVNNSDVFTKDEVLNKFESGIKWNSASSVQKNEGKITKTVEVVTVLGNEDTKYSDDNNNFELQSSFSEVHKRIMAKRNLKPADLLCLMKALASINP